MNRSAPQLLAALALFALADAAPAAAPGGPTSTETKPTPEGLGPSDWQSIRAAYEAGRHSFAPTENGWRARNPSQRWTTEFDGRGFLATPDEGGWTWGLVLLSYGIGEDQIPIAGTPSVHAEGQRLAYRWDERLEEWWINDRRGLEHGFVVAERPGGGDQADASGLLRLHLATRGGLVPNVSPDALGVVFEDDEERAVLNYAGLKVWDAEGRILASRFQADEGSTVRLVVDDRGARYPVTIDPLAQQAYLKAGNSEENDQFGFSVAVSGDTVVVGAPWESSDETGVTNGPGGSADNSASASGAAYVFVRSGSTWSQQAYLKAGNAEANDFFGCSVAVSGDTVVVGARTESSDETGVTNGPGGSADNSASSSGAAYVFVRSGSTWSQQAYLKAGNTGTSDAFGNSVSVSGDTVVVGSPGESSNVTGPINGTGGSADNSLVSSGASYVFVRSGSTWSQEAYLKAGNTDAGDTFGRSVAVSGDTVVVGADRENSNETGVTNGTGGSANNGAIDSGAAYVFVRSGSTWSQQAYLKAGNTGGDDRFGESVAVSGDTVVVGANFEDSNASGVANGAGGSADNSSMNSGAAYVFARSGSTWSQQAYLKAGNANMFDQFGWSVAVSGDTVVVSAIAEDSNETGVNETDGGSINNSADLSGAAYVFARSGSTWSQQAYVKAGNTDGHDYFGHSVAVSGDTIVVGAVNEGSNETGVTNGPGGSADNSEFASGAAYVFDAPAPAAPKLKLSRPKRFPTTKLRKRSRPQTVSVTNTGGSPATGPFTSLSGPGKHDFLLARFSKAPLAPGAKRKLSVRFAPKRPGVRKATLAIRSSAPRVSATLSGKGR